MVVLSGLAGIATLGLVWRERYGLARATSALAVICVTVGWALAQDPYVLPQELTLDEAAASDATLTAVVIAVGLGMLILAPSLWFLYRLSRGGSTRSSSRSTSASGRSPPRTSPGAPGPAGRCRCSRSPASSSESG